MLTSGDNDRRVRREKSLFTEAQGLAGTGMLGRRVGRLQQRHISHQDSKAV